MIKARASGSEFYLCFMKKGRQARHRIQRNYCGIHSSEISCNAETKADISSAVLNCSGVNHS